MDDLKSRFEKAKNEYGSLKEGCESLVVRWRWASWRRHEPQPYYFKRNRFLKGYWLKEAPAHLGGGQYQYGFDGEGRIQVARTPALDWDEEFFAYSK
jgi:hypothetical protein